MAGTAAGSRANGWAGIVIAGLVKTTITLTDIPAMAMAMAINMDIPAMAMAMDMDMDIRAMTSPRLSASGSLTLTIITSADITGITAEDITAEDITGGITVASKPNGGIRHDTVTLSFPAKLGDREGSIGVGEGSVWVTDKQLLTRFNAASGAEEAKIELPGEGAGVAVAFGSVWITSPRKNALYRVDPKTNAVAQTTALEPRPRFLTADADSLWILDHGGFLQGSFRGADRTRAGGHGTSNRRSHEQTDRGGNSD